MRIGVLGASGGVGRLVVEALLEQGHEVVAQTRDASRLSALAGRIRIHAFLPTDADACAAFAAGLDAVVFALGIGSIRPTSLFSDATAVLLAAMRQAGVRRLVAITGVGAGETRGHGGKLYDWLNFPLFTRHRYADKERQEALIRASGLDWTIIRPARYVAQQPPGPLETHDTVAPGLVLTGITREEVARFVAREVADARHLRAAPFIGHR